jgi:glycosyltransferase involved in cell wall biosynthesis
MAHGLPIITSITGVAKDLIEKERIGICYSDSNINEFEDRLNRVNFQDETFLNLSNNSRLLFKNEFSFEIIYGKLIEHLKLLAEKSK